MAHGILGLDHLVVAVRDLEQARDVWTRLGFTCTPRGRHRNLATGNYCIMFPEDYVELIGIVDPSMPDRGLMSRMDEDGEGLDRLAFGAPDVDATAQALAADGYGMRGPMDLHRPLELPGGEVEPRFRLMHFEDPASTPGIHGFICHHVTPEITRGEPDWLVHANAVTSVASVTCVSESPGDLQTGWQKLLGDEAAVLSEGRLTVFTGKHRLDFVTRPMLQELFPTTAEKLDRPTPCIAAATFNVADLDQTEAHLKRNSINHIRHKGGDIEVMPAEANGAIVVFTQA